jgi:aspartyl/asparaginyl-tRNA synthetase
MIEPEIAFADLACDAKLAEDLLKYIFTALLAGARRRHEVLRRAHRQGPASSGSRAFVERGLRDDGLHRRDPQRSRTRSRRA